MEILHLASTILLTFFIALLVAKRGKSLADRILFFWLLCLLLNIVTILVIERGWAHFTLLLNFSDSSIFLHGPLIWFYTLALTRPDFGLRFRDGLHFIPFLTVLSGLYALELGAGAVPESYRSAIVVLKLSAISIYLGAALHQLYRYKRNIPHYFSFTERVQLNWLELLCWGGALILSIAIISLSLHFLTPVEIPFYGGLYTNIALSVFTIVLAYNGVRQSSYLSAPVEASPGAGHMGETSKYKRSGRERSEGELLFARLETHMKTERPFLEADLTLFKLATRVGMPANQLSQVINAQGEKNFFDYVNGYRVEEVKRRIENKDYLQQTLLTIAFDSGFNSKASFNRAFKKMTGQTPSQYKKQVALRRPNHQS